MSANEPARVLFVDDEPMVLSALARQMRHLVQADTETDPLTAGRRLEQAAAADQPYAVVVSDMRMPVMDGAALLKHSRATSPTTTRILLTGYTDIDSAIAAVNDGNIFRFLTKPCHIDTLRTAIADAIEQNQLLRDQRELLDTTLRGAVKALVEILAMAHPAGFARASRLGRLSTAVATRLDLPDIWCIEVAAQLGELGVVTLPDAALDAPAHGSYVDPQLTQMLHRLPRQADDILKNIPRLEPVRALIRAQEPVDSPDPARLAQATLPAQVLQAVREYDALLRRDFAPPTAIGLLQQRPHHPAGILSALLVEAAASSADQVKEVDLGDLRPGNVLAGDLHSSNGLLLVTRGQPLSDALLIRIRNHATVNGIQGRPVIVVTPTDQDSRPE
jgi:response regulator RpfG family c-di-GMP phosphodiesterase